MLRLLALVSVVAACSAPAPAPGTQPVMPGPAPAAATETAPAGNTTGAAPATYHADPVINRIITLGRTDSQVQAHVTTLVERFGPRLTGSHALMDAEVWARDQFASFGLEARLERWGEVPVGFDRGPFHGRMVAPEAMELDFITPSWTPGVHGPHQGAALSYPLTAKAARALGASASGAWIVETKRSGELDDKVRTAVEAELSRAGVAGYVRRARDPAGALVHTSGRYKIAWSKLPARVTINLRGDQYDIIAGHLSEGREVALSFSIDNRFFNGPVPQHNVIADIRGSEEPDEYVIVGGHLDSWDGAAGAVDNGTGVATTLEAARLLMKAGAKPRRTIRFMLWGGEEQGLLGSSAYVKQHPELMDRISAVLVHDGGTNYLSGLSVTPEMAAQATRALEPAFGLDPAMPLGLYYAAELQRGGSDHTPFIAAGVPAFFWRQSGRADYKHAHHTQHDTLDAVVPEYQRHSAMVVAIAALGLANDEALLDRTDAAPLSTGRRLGVELDGTRITSVAPKTHAARAGLAPGDVLVRIGDTEIKTWRELVRGLRSKGDTKTLVVRRGKKTRTVTLDFGAGPNAAKIAARQARRQERFGDIEYGALFAGAAPPEDTEGDSQGEKADREPNDPAE